MASAKRAVTGAATGAAAGSAFGPWGTAIGGGIGLLGGLFGGGDDNAAQDGLAKAYTGLGDLQKTQRIQRGEDLNRALSMFGPVDDYMSRMYGVEKPRAYISPDASQTRSGPGHFGLHGGSNAPPPPPSAATPQAMLGGAYGPYGGANSGGMQTDPAVRAQMLAAQAAQQKRARGY